MILKIRWRPKLRDRIICRIQDQQLREELPKIPDFDLQRYLSICRAAKFSETRTKTLEEGVAVNSLKEQTKRGKVSPNKRHDNSVVLKPVFTVFTYTEWSLKAETLEQN